MLYVISMILYMRLVCLKLCVIDVLVFLISILVMIGVFRFVSDVKLLLSVSMLLCCVFGVILVSIVGLIEYMVKVRLLLSVSSMSLVVCGMFGIGSIVSIVLVIVSVIVMKVLWLWCDGMLCVSRVCDSYVSVRLSGDVIVMNSVNMWLVLCGLKLSLSCR